jgi:hypothetical protein
LADKVWLDDTPYDLLDRNLKRLGASMLVGAVYDVVLGLMSLAFPSWILGWLGQPLPASMFYFYLWPVMHLVFACFYTLAWMDPKRNIVIVTGAIVARLLYAGFMFVSVLMLGVGSTWAFFGVLSLILAVVHYVFLRLSDFGFWEVFVRAGNPPGMRRS